MAPAKSTSQPVFEEEIARLEAELARVIALSTTSDSDRTDLTDRLRRLKEKAGIP